jgi:ABC-2 type transport system ATP-binding protein
MHAIDIADLTVDYGDFRAVDDITFHVAAGEIVALLGPNGAGKTSTIEVIEGYRAPTMGQAHVHGEPPGSNNSRIGVLLQEDGIYPAARPIDVVRLFRALYGDRGPSVDALLESVGLGSKSRSTIRRMSGGEKRRLGLALALAGSPDVLLLDEPTAGVDHAGRAQLRTTVREARDAGAAVLLTTHELDEAQKLADRIIIIDKGVIVAQGTPEELTQATTNSGIRFTTEPNLDLTYLVIVLGAQITEIAPGDYHAATKPTPQAVAKLTAWMAERQIMLGEIRAGTHRLEDIFEQLTTGDATPESPGSDL